jgi:periplasmic divalent cation tolerance protein
MRNSDAQILVVLVTTPSRREAVRIGDAVVKQKLAACANVLSSVTSIFRWKGRIEKSREALLIMKTTPRRYAALANAVRSMHPYEVPEVIALKVTKGLPRYIAWVHHETAID